MGSSYIGYIVSGPKELDSTHRALAIKHLEKLKGYLPLLLKHVGEVVPPAWFLELAERQNIDLTDMAELQEAGEAILTEIGRDSEAYASSFLELWNDGGDDVLSTTVGEYKVLATGESSWGDEPESDAYQSLKWAYNLGLEAPLKLNY